MAERPIDAELLKRMAERLIKDEQDYGASPESWEKEIENFKTLIDTMPTIEAKPIVHAHWDEVNGGRTICTNCGNYPLYDYFGRLKISDICPHCGAQMDEKEGATNV